VAARVTTAIIETTTSRSDVAVDALVERDLAAARGVLPPASVLWLATAAAGFTVRTELLGVSSILHQHSDSNIKPECGMETGCKP